MFELKNRASLFGVGLVLVAGLPMAAVAQIATPAPENDDAEAAEYVPPPPPPEFTAEGRAQLAEQEAQRQAARDAQLAAQADATPDRPKRRGIPDTNIPSNLLARKEISLVRGDETGRLIDWWGPLALHAMRLSPLVSEGSQDVVEPVVHSRHSRVEQRLIANLDLYREVETTDVLDQGDNLQELANLSQMLEPLVEPANISIELYEAEALTAMQAKFTERMIAEYKKELTKKIQAAEPAQRLAEFTRFLMKDGLREIRFAHDLIVAELLMDYDAIVDEAGLADVESFIPISEIAGGLDGQPSRSQVIDATGPVLALPIDDHQRLLETVRNRRENSDVHPLIVVVLQGDGQGKPIYSEGGGVTTGYEALDPAATGDLQIGLAATQRPYYEDYLRSRWVELDPDATGHYRAEIKELYHELYDAWVSERRTELEASGNEETDGG